MKGESEMVFNLKISGLTFEIHSLYKYVAYGCKDYLIQESGEHRIDITQEDIDAERETCRRTDFGIDENLVNAPDHYLEYIVLLRKLADYIVHYNRILMHGSSISVNGNGYIFTALSGTGKSTHTGLLRQLHGENAVMINDDKPFLHVTDDGVYVCGTPWMGKHRLGNNMMVPLKGIFFLRRSEDNQLKELSVQNALMPLVSQCHRPSDPEKLMLTFDLIEAILGKVKLYDFGCNMDISAAELSSSVMN